VLKGCVEIYIKSDAEEVVMDYLGKGSVIGQFSVLNSDKMLFGARAATAGGVAIVALHKHTLDKLRTTKSELDQVLLQSEEALEKIGTPQIDFLHYNDLMKE